MLAAGYCKWHFVACSIIMFWCYKMKVEKRHLDKSTSFLEKSAAVDLGVNEVIMIRSIT